MASNNELEVKATPSLVEYRPPAASTQRDAWKNTADGKRNAQLIQVLQAVLPPREFQDEASGEERWQQVSWDPSTRDDVIALQMKLDERLQERQARESGICPVREELHAQCFDELIRQVTIESPERGLLLRRVRDEARMTIAAYQTLYQSSITFGMRKSLQAEQGNAALQKRIEELEANKRALQTKVLDLKGLQDSLEKRNAELRLQEETRMQEENDFLSFQAQSLEQFLKQTQA